MSMSSITRESGNATTLPSAMPRQEALSRRKALGAAAVIALSVALGAASLPAQATSAAIVAAASPDATLIAHANRLANLARRCDAAVNRRISIEDRISELCPAPTLLPKPRHADNIDETRTPTERVFTIRQPLKRDPALVRWEEAAATAKDAHERQQEDLASRLGLPAIVRRTERMERRRDRWANDLTMMRPATAARLAAKASVVMALMGVDAMEQDGELVHRADLVLSVLADAVRLGTGTLS